MLDKLNNNRNQILFIELAGLLHDIGKLSKAFLEYRQIWQSDPHGYDNDPHDHSYLERHEVFKDLVPSEFKKKPDEISSLGKSGCISWEPDFSIEKAIHRHTQPAEAVINKMLQAADGIDAAIDRNNPLWSAEQKDMVFKSNVFGYEKERMVTFESQEMARKELYGFLGKSLPGYFEDFNNAYREAILSKIKKAFEVGLSDTTRPQNDTTLWEHSYAVASILKVVCVYNLFHEEDKIDRFDKVKFGILGIGWDGMRFLSYGQKISDIVARKKIIEDTKDCLQKLIEYEYPVGNTIYADDDGIYFVVPLRFNEKFKEIKEKIEDEIYDRTVEKSHGELQPHIVDVSETTTLTSLVWAIQAMKKKTAYHFNRSAKGFKCFETYLKYFENKKTVCPICRRRPVEKEDDVKKICIVCKKRRTQNFYEEDNIPESSKTETLFIDEIVDNNNRAALIVVRFGLDDWLNGKMVRSLFVTEIKGIEREINNLGNVKQFEKEEKAIGSFLASKKSEYGKFNYHRIKSDVDSFSDKISEERAKYTAFLYDRRNYLQIEKINPCEIFRRWAKMRDAVIQEVGNFDFSKFDILLYNILNAKTPTPSTILDVWESTLEFIQDIPKNILRSLLPENKRLEISVELKEGENIEKGGNGTLDAEVVSTKEKIELLYKEQEKFEVVGEIYTADSSRTIKNEWQGKEIRIIDKESDSFGNLYEVNDSNPGVTIVPYRTITESPNLFMAIVPAKRAVEITNLIYQKYKEQFGKVMGRLPFSIGNIFFGNKMPMFVVLDAGKRMVANFDNLAGDLDNNEGDKKFVVTRKPECAGSNIGFDLKSSVGGFCKSFTWRLPYKLGNCDDDYHHPYFIVDSSNKDLSAERSTFFKTIAGDVIHFTEIKEGDKLCVYPNYYDFEFLDSNTRRHDIHLKDGRRKSNVADFKSKPFLLDELSQKIMRLWKELLQGKQLKGITDTKLRNLQSLWLTKYQEWNVDIGNKTSAQYEQWVNLVTTSIKKEFKELDNEQCGLLQETIGNGLFFDTLELYLGILKERISID